MVLATFWSLFNIPLFFLANSVWEICLIGIKNGAPKKCVAMSGILLLAFAIPSYIVACLFITVYKNQKILKTIPLSAEKKIQKEKKIPFLGKRFIIKEKEEKKWVKEAKK
ncbi:hypothetical protein HY643_02920 [Candidatus Woesearchaeota archaeon]|nr:hypothetical protein [Candidatus Woesearchaeota archaeon]